MADSMEPCDHILAFEEGVDESWLAFQSNNRRSLKEIIAECGGVMFRYCPLCGKDLTEI